MLVHRHRFDTLVGVTLLPLGHSLRGGNLVDFLARRLLLDDNLLAVVELANDLLLGTWRENIEVVGRLA